MGNLGESRIGQPFASAGSYTDFKRITEPRATAYKDRFYEFEGSEIVLDDAGGTYGIDEDLDGIEDYSFGDPNFNFLQFRSNLVIRWEYKPGSSLFIVWSQGRTTIQSFGDFTLMDNMQDLFQ